MPDRKGLPHNWETERALLGGLLLDPQQLMEVRERLKAEDFHRPHHKALFLVIGELADKEQTPDPAMVLDELVRRDALESCGGAAYVLGLPQACPSVENLPSYAARVHDHAVRRRLLLAAQTVIEDVQAGERDTPGLLDEAERAIFEISQLSGPRDWHRLSSVLDLQILELQKRAENPGDVTGIPTGFVDLDRKLAGLQRTDLLILAARPAMGKCVAADTSVVLGDGSVRTIEEVVRGTLGPVFSLGSDAKLRAVDPSAWVDDGHKPLFRVRTASGREISTTLTHPFLTARGWRPLAEIAVGDAVAIPRVLPVFGTATLRDCELKLLAYLLGDGCLTDGCPEFTNTDDRLRDEFRSAVSEFGGVETREERVGARAPTVVVRARSSDVVERRTAFAGRLRARIRGAGVTAREVATRAGVSPASVSHWIAATTVPDESVALRLADTLEAPDLAEGARGARKNAPNALTLWLTGLGLWGHGAGTKFVPDRVFGLGRPELALFLNRLFATDGWASVLETGQVQVGYGSTSGRLIRQVAHLLLRFGIFAAIKRRNIRLRGQTFPSWQLDVTDQVSILRFCTEIGIFGKEEDVTAVRHAVEARRPGPGRDVFPAALWDRIEAAKGRESWASLARRAGVTLHPRRGGLSRSVLGRVALAVGDAELRDLAAGDVLFDDIVEIEAVGLGQVYDLTVPGTHNFVANDVCVHNTAFALNIALNAALRSEAAVGLFSLEMSRQQLATRMLCSEARVDASKVRTGHLGVHEDWPRLMEAAERLHALPIFIDDTPGLTIGQLRSKARRLRAEHPNLGLVVIDYLQLMQGSGGAKESRENVISNISRGLKILAKELEVPVLALSQLNRSLESRTDKRPLPSDLRESGAIEQDADVILFIYRDEVYHEDSPDKGIAEIIIAKQRSGPIGTVKLAFLGQYVLFQNLAGGGDPQGGYY